MPVISTRETLLNFPDSVGVILYTSRILLLDHIKQIAETILLAALVVERVAFRRHVVEPDLLCRWFGDLDEQAPYFGKKQNGV